MVTSGIKRRAGVRAFEHHIALLVAKLDLFMRLDNLLEPVALNDPIPVMAVGFSDFEAMRSIAQHVLDHGRKCIGYVDFHTPNIRRYAERRNGFLGAVRDSGRPGQLIFITAA